MSGGVAGSCDPEPRVSGRLQTKAWKKVRENHFDDRTGITRRIQRDLGRTEEVELCVWFRFRSSEEDEVRVCREENPEPLARSRLSTKTHAHRYRSKQAWIFMVR